MRNTSARRVPSAIVAIATGSVLAATLAACASSPAGSGGSSSSSVGMVSIGNLADLSGACSAPGIPASKGIQLAVRNINKHPFTVAGKKYKLNLITMDTTSDNTTAVNDLVSMVKDDNVTMVVGPGCGAYSDPGLGPLAIKYGIILFNPLPSPQLDNPAQASQFANGQGYLLPAAQASSAESAKAQAGIIKVFPDFSKIKKIALMNEDNALGHDFGAELQAYYNSLGYMTTSVYYPTTSVDYSGYLTTIKNSHPDLLLYGNNDPTGLAILKQAVSLNVAPRYYGYGTALSDAVNVNGSAGISAPQVSLEYTRSLQYPDTPAMKQFAAQYEAFNGGSLGADSSYAAYLYDDPGLLVAAMEKAGTTTDLHAIAMALYSLHYSGLASPDEYFDSTHHLHFDIDGCYVAPGPDPSLHVTCTPVKQ